MSNSKTTAHKEGQASVRVVYYTSKTLADGTHPFMLCVTKNRQRKYVATGLGLHPKYWNEEKKEIRRSYPGDAKKLWRQLNEKATAFEQAAEALADSDEQHDAETVLHKVSESRRAVRRVKLLTYCDELISNFKAAGQLGNARVYQDARNQLSRFILDEYKSEDIPFERVTVAFCHDWEQTMRATGAEDTSLSVRFRTLRAVFNKAIAVGAAKPAHYLLLETEPNSTSTVLANLT